MSEHDLESSLDEALVEVRWRSYQRTRGMGKVKSTYFRSRE